jgi:hypothetical protein
VSQVPEVFHARTAFGQLGSVKFGQRLIGTKTSAGPVGAGWVARMPSCSRGWRGTFFACTAVQPTAGVPRSALD